MRDLEKVPGEWSLICAGHNLLKLFRYGRWADRSGRQPRIPDNEPLPGYRPIGVAG